MTDKRGLSRDSERFQSIPENEKPRDLDKETRDLIKGIKPAEQMPKKTLKTIDEIVEECRAGKKNSVEDLNKEKYKLHADPDFSLEELESPGSLASLYVNNLLEENYDVKIAKSSKENSKGGYAIYKRKKEV